MYIVTKLKVIKQQQKLSYKKTVILYQYHQIVAISIATKQPDERRAAVQIEIAKEELIERFNRSTREKEVKESFWKWVEDNEVSLTELEHLQQSLPYAIGTLKSKIPKPVVTIRLH